LRSDQFKKAFIFALSLRPGWWRERPVLVTNGYSVTAEEESSANDGKDDGMDQAYFIGRSA